MRKSTQGAAQPTWRPTHLASSDIRVLFSCCAEDVPQRVNARLVSCAECWSGFFFLAKLSFPTTNGGVQNGRSVGTCTRCTHVFCTFWQRICMLSRCSVTKISASELRRKFIKSALLVGFFFFLFSFLKKWLASLLLGSNQSSVRPSCHFFFPSPLSPHFNLGLRHHLHDNNFFFLHLLLLEGKFQPFFLISSPVTLLFLQE